MTIRMILVGVVFALLGTMVQAGGNLALIIANKDYRNFSDSRDAFDAASLNQTLVDAGFDVRTIRNMSRKAMAQLAPVIREEIEQADRVLVFISGHVFSTSRESWFMATDTQRQDGLLTGAYGLPINALIDLMGEKAGAAVLLVGDSGNPVRLGRGLTYGYVPNDIAQGVTVFTGRTSRLVTLARKNLLQPGTSTLDAAEQAPRGVTASGFLSRTVAFLPFEAAPAPDQDDPVDELELLIWENAKAVGTVAGVSSYLDRFPDGRFVRDAQEILAGLQRSPAEIARDAELNLNLSREARREIQRALSLLNFDTRGVDGIFGPGSRAAITAWQKTAGYDANGYFTDRQISALEAEASKRALELEEQDRIRRLEMERRDAEYWRSTGRGKDEAGLRAYVGKYPDGLYSEIALDRLAVYDEERRNNVEIAEGNAWDLAQEADTIESYKVFLSNASYRKGVFGDAARARITELKANLASNPVVAEERRILSNPITRVLVEQKLASLGFKPGRVDGKIDDGTRKAVRQFQRAADLPVNGFVTQATIVRLLAAR